MNKKISKLLSLVFGLVLAFQQSGFAQMAPGYAVSSHAPAGAFRAPHLRYLSYDGLNRDFQLLIDKGDLKDPSAKEIEDASRELLKYFFIGLSLPNDSFWVNLRPDSPDNVIDPYLARTDIGRIMLETDVQLKKDTARFTSPATPEGKQYWDELYRKAGEIFGSDTAVIPTMTRPWIVPDEVVIRETAASAYVYKATLKVMLEQDYLKGSAEYGFTDERSRQLNEFSSQLIRKLIIPKLTKEINTSARYAQLRQVYYSLIMAQWFKARFSARAGLYSSLIDRKVLTNLTSEKDWSPAQYFQAYQKSFKDGEYNIQGPALTASGRTIRTYVSGGELLQLPRISAVGDVAVVDPKTGGSVDLRPATAEPNLERSYLASVSAQAADDTGTTVVIAMKDGGSYRWGTQDEGLRNVRDAIRKNAPALLEGYDRFVSLPVSAEKEALGQTLREEIHQITQGHLIVWGLSTAIDQKTAPYFRGSLVGMWQEVFPALELDPLGFQLDWSSKDRGIASVRYVIARERPDIIERYDNLAKLSARGRRALQEDIYRITQAIFRVWGLSTTTDARKTPYFHGSHIGALQEVFSALELDPLGFQLDCSTPERTIASVRYVLNRERPRIITRYDRLSTLSETERQALREDIYRINEGYFDLWGLTGALKTETVPYRSYITVLQEVFPDLDLDPLGFQLDWSSRQRGIASIRFVLQRERPDIIERYDNLAQLSETERRALLEDIYRIDSGDFRSWGMAAATGLVAEPYFHNSYIDALAAVFDDPRLGFSGEELREFRKMNTVKRYHWVLKEEGLFSVRDGIKLNRPDILKQYDRFVSSPASAEKDALGQILREEIYRITAGDFRAWGLSGATGPVAAPYFHGSHIVALQELFPALDLEPLGFRLEWGDEGKAIDSIRYVLKMERPDIIERYDDRAALSGSERQALREDVYRITEAHLEVWGLRTVVDPRTAPYFNGSYVRALQEVFSALNLDPLGFRPDVSSKDRALASVRYVLGRERPQVMERYDALERLSKAERQALREEIYRITQSHFEVWGLKGAMRGGGATPYFQGSFIVTLQEVFPGLGLDPLGFQLDWSNRERGIASVRFVLGRERPDIVERYDDLPRLDDAGRQALREDVYAITSAHFKAWGLGKALNAKGAPYFGGSYIRALQEVLPALALERTGFPGAARDGGAIAGDDMRRNSMDPGGIDFRALPVVAGAMDNLRIHIPRISADELSALDLDREFGKIQRMVDMGSIPSAERIGEYMQAACARGEAAQETDRVVSCIADVLRQEEGRAGDIRTPDDAVLKDILSVLESGRSDQEIEAVFTGSRSFN